MMVMVLFPAGSAGFAIPAADFTTGACTSAGVAADFSAGAIWRIATRAPGSAPSGLSLKTAKPRNASRNRPISTAVAWVAENGSRSRRRFLRTVSCPSGVLRSSAVSAIFLPGAPNQRRRQYHDESSARQARRGSAVAKAGSNTLNLILRSRALARRLEGWTRALVAHPSRLAEDGEHLRMTGSLARSKPESGCW